MELESYFEVKGLPGHQKELVYNVHNAAFLLARAGISESRQSRPGLSVTVSMHCL